MIKVRFKWISRIKFNAIPVKDPNTIYFIYNEHVLYKGDQMYGGIQTISYTVDENGDYIVTIVNGDGSTTELQIASSSNYNRLKQAIILLQEDLDTHIATKGTEDTSAHVKLTDTPITSIDEKGQITSNQDVASNIAVTPKGVASMMDNFKAFLKFPSYLKFPVAGNENLLYLAEDTGYLWVYKNGGYNLISDNWRRIKEIKGIID